MNIIHKRHQAGGTLISNFPHQERETVAASLTPDMVICDEAYDTNGQRLPHLFSVHSVNPNAALFWDEYHKRTPPQQTLSNS